MWYSVQAVFKSYINNSIIEDSLNERNIFLIETTLEEKGIQEKARKTALEFEIEYLNGDNEIVSWKLHEILDIQEIEEELYDGIEIVSSFSSFV